MRAEEKTNTEGEGDIVLETPIPLLIVDGIPLLAFETEDELRRFDYPVLPDAGANGVELDHVSFHWDSRLAEQRQEERTGLLKAFRERNAIVSYMRQAYPERFMSSTDVAEAVVLEMESRWSRKLSTLFSAFKSRLPLPSARKGEKE